MNLSKFALLIFYVISARCHELQKADYVSQLLTGDYSTNITIQVDSNVEYILHFPVSTSKYPYTIFAWSFEAFFHHPVFIVARQLSDVTSWQLPLPVTSKSGILKFGATSRTLCHTNMDVIADMPRNLTMDTNSSNIPELHKQLSMSISSATQIPTSVTIRVEEQDNFYLEEGRNYSAIISPSEPKYFYYKFHEQEIRNTVLLEVDSEDNICLTVSIQNPTCPVSDLNQVITFEGKYQTIDTKGGIIIKPNEFPNGFFVVFVAKGDNFECSHHNSLIPMPRTDFVQTLNRSSQVFFTITPSISSHDYVFASLLTLGLIFFFYLAFALTTWGFYRWNYKLIKEESHAPVDLEPTFMGQVVRSAELKLATKKLVLAHLAQKNLAHFEKKSYAYLWHVLSIAIFYGIPVVQLVITYQRVVNISGNQDICYYNFLCAHPLFGLSDFNHIYSNIGYVLVGILFLFITFYKHHFVPHSEAGGIPKHYGLFYAMGVALIMEGILSACYHICPTQSNFQFDTSFMYVMAALCLIKLYQNRHPDINATAYATFLILGFAIFAAMVGVLNGHIVLWVIFIILYIVLCLYVSFNIYFLSYIKLGLHGMIQEWNEERDILRTIRPKRKAHFVVLIIANVLNVIFANLGIVCYFQGTDFATFLLALLMANVIMYATVYVVMKIINHEKITVQAALFGILGLITWGTACYFFIKNSTMWTVTPAESRKWNTHCIVMDFYDNHDIWHLLSAPALFFSFMLLLTLDDDLINTPRENIAVF